MERQSVITDKNSGITNDANLWATETTGNPSYPLELLQRVITVSLEMMKIVNNLPSLGPVEGTSDSFSGKSETGAGRASENRRNSRAAGLATS